MIPSGGGGGLPILLPAPIQYLPPSRAIAESEERAKKLSAGEPPLPIAGAACMGEGEEEETSAITFVHLH